MKRIVGLGWLGLALVGCADEATDQCANVQCVSAPAPECDGTTKVVYVAIGTCATNPTGAVICDYPVAQRQDCAALGGKICQAGQCKDKVPDPVVPCEGVTCIDPPAPDCDGQVARIYKSQGTCNPATLPAGACEYGTQATLDCGAQGMICRRGGCIVPGSTPCDPNPCDVPPLGTCDGQVPSQSAATGTCAVAAGKAVCTYTTTAGAACTGLTSDCRGGVCGAATAPPAAAGDLVFDELLINPVAAGDEGEWVELWNPSTTARVLDGCVLRDDGDDTYTVPGGVETATVVVPAHGYLVLGRSADAVTSGGVVPDLVYSGITLANTADELELVCGGIVIDRVAWSDGWPSGTGLALSLDPGHANAASNDAPTAWCLASTLYGDQTNRGTPRRPNPSCP